MENVNSIVTINTNITTGCKHCQTQIGGPENFAESVNHYISEHGYKIIHIGSETTPSMDGSPWHTTVAVLGI